MGKSEDTSGNQNEKALYRLGGIAAIVLGLSYVIITVLYILGGALPTSSEEWLRHLAKHTAEWWGILGLSVLTDFLFLLVAWALYNALKDVDRNAMAAGAGLLSLFVVLDLAITWPNFSALITLSGKYNVALGETQRMALVAAANYAHEILSSRLFAVYVILVPALGIFLIGFVMLKEAFHKITAYLGVATGILGLIAVVGPFFIAALGMMVIITSILTTIWVFFVGYKLLKLGS
jgi:hypothetical protein